MRTGLIVSVTGHAALLLWGVVSLPPPKSLDLSNLEAVPVDFVPIDELTKLNIGVTAAEAREEIVPEPPAPVTAELPPEPEAVPPAPEPEPSPPPEPAAAEPPPPPEPPDPLPEPRTVATPEPEAPQLPPPPPEKELVEPAPAVPVPRPRPKPPTVVAKAKPDKTFNTDQIAALLDKREPTRAAQPDETPPNFGSSTGSIATRMTVNELDALRSRMAECWNIQMAPPDLAELKVTLKLFLNRDGSLSQPPQVMEVGSSEFARSAAESAVRAVRRCAPYNLPPEKYDSWREIIMNFDPSQMFGG